MNESAFPTMPDHHGYNGTEGYPHGSGMTLRDYFAAQAMAFWAGQHIGGWCGDFPSERAQGIAKHCYIMADAMLEARREAPRA